MATGALVPVSTYEVSMLTTAFCATVNVKLRFCEGPFTGFFRSEEVVADLAKG